MLEVLCPFDVFNTTRSKSFLVKNTAVFVVEQDGELSAFVNRCPHQGIPLDWGNDQFLDVDGELTIWPLLRTITYANFASNQRQQCVHRD